MKRKSGQILVLILLVVVVALSVGLSVASRNITNIRTTTQTEQSQRAFSAAEGGVEDILARLSTIASQTAVASSEGYKDKVQVGELTADVTVRAANVYEALVSEGTVAQIDLGGATGGQIQIEWAKTGDETESAKPASIEVTQVFKKGQRFNQARSAWSGGNFGGERDETGFTTPNCFPSTNFAKCTRVTLELQAVFLRIRPFWNRATIKVASVDGNLPVQTYDVVSTATTELGVTRKVQVQRTALPQLPAAFDYVLFSESGVAK